jgi:hypothetical protein
VSYLGAATFAPSAPGLWSTSCSIWLWPNEGGDGMAAMGFFSDDLKLCDLHYLAFSHHSSSYSAFFHLAYYHIKFFVVLGL